MSASRSETPEVVRLAMPESHRDLDVFPVDQATLEAQQRGDDIGSLQVSDSGQRLKHVGQNPVMDGGNYFTDTWWLARLYTKGPHHDLNIGTMLRESPGVVAGKLKDVKAHLEDPFSGDYFVVVHSATDPARHDDSRIHQLARLREIGMTDRRELFSVLERADHSLGYRALSPMRGTAHSALYRYIVTNTSLLQ